MRIGVGIREPPSNSQSYECRGTRKNVWLQLQPERVTEYGPFAAKIRKPRGQDRSTEPTEQAMLLSVYSPKRRSRVHHRLHLLGTAIQGPGHIDHRLTDFRLRHDESLEYLCPLVPQDCSGTKPAEDYYRVEPAGRTGVIDTIGFEGIGNRLVERREFAPFLRHTRQRSKQIRVGGPSGRLNSAAELGEGRSFSANGPAFPQIELELV